MPHHWDIIINEFHFRTQRGVQFADVSALMHVCSLHTFFFANGEKLKSASYISFIDPNLFIFSSAQSFLTPRVLFQSGGEFHLIFFISAFFPFQFHVQFYFWTFKNWNGLDPASAPEH